jgi:hypothetical protein
LSGNSPLMNKTLLTFLLLCFALPLIAQEPLSIRGSHEKSSYGMVIASQHDYLNKLYYENVGKTDEMINGRDYIPYYLQSKLKPILFFDKKHTSSIKVNGRIHSDLSLDYDTFLDELIYTDSANVIDFRITKIALNKDPIESFSIYSGEDTLTFRFFTSETLKKFSLQEGFYEVAYEGTCKYIIRHRSFLLERNGLYDYIYTPASYIMSGDKFLRIKSSHDFIRLFGEKSAEIKRFIRIGHIKIRKADKRQIVTVLNFYESLLAKETAGK